MQNNSIFSSTVFRAIVVALALIQAAKAGYMRKDECMDIMRNNVDAVRIFAQDETISTFECLDINEEFPSSDAKFKVVANGKKFLLYAFPKAHIGSMDYFVNSGVSPKYTKLGGSLGLNFYILDITGMQVIKKSDFTKDPALAFHINELVFNLAREMLQKSVHPSVWAPSFFLLSNEQNKVYLENRLNVSSNGSDADVTEWLIDYLSSYTIESLTADESTNEAIKEAYSKLAQQVKSERELGNSLSGLTEVNTLVQDLIAQIVSQYNASQAEAQNVEQEVASTEANAEPTVKDDNKVDATQTETIKESEVTMTSTEPEAEKLDAKASSAGEFDNLAEFFDFVNLEDKTKTSEELTGKLGSNQQKKTTNKLVAEQPMSKTTPEEIKPVATLSTAQANKTPKAMEQSATVLSSVAAPIETKKAVEKQKKSAQPIISKTQPAKIVIDGAQKTKLAAETKPVDLKANQQPKPEPEQKLAETPKTEALLPSHELVQPELAAESTVTKQDLSDNVDDNKNTKDQVNQDDKPASETKKPSGMSRQTKIILAILGGVSLVAILVVGFKLASKGSNIEGTETHELRA